MRTHVVRTKADIVASKLGIIGKNVVRSRADVVATKLGIILIGANVVLAHERFPCGGRRSGH